MTRPAQRRASVHAGERRSRRRAGHGRRPATSRRRAQTQPDNWETWKRLATIEVQLGLAAGPRRCGSAAGARPTRSCSPRQGRRSLATCSRSRCPTRSPTVLRHPAAVRRRCRSVEGQRQAVLEFGRGRPAEVGGGPRRVDRDPLHLAGAGRRELGLEGGRPARARAAARPGLSTLVSRPVPMLIGAASPPSRPRPAPPRPRRPHICSRGSGVPSPKTVGRPPAAQPAAEDRDHARLAERVLARAVDVAEPQADPGEAVEPLVERQVALGRRTCSGRRGRAARSARPRRSGSCLALALAVDRPAGGDEDDARRVRPRAPPRAGWRCRRR